MKNIDLFQELRFQLNYYQLKLEMWWHHLWETEEERIEIREALRKRRESGGCSKWRNYLKGHPEAAKYAWEKEFVKEIKKINE